MPRQSLMSWDPEPNARWVKMYKGVRYRVTCEELQAPRTKEGSLTKANAWWLKKKAEIDGTPEPDPVEVLTEQFQQERLETLLENPLFQEVSEHAIAKLEQPTDPDRTLGHWGQQFLNVKRPTMKPRTYEEIHEYINKLPVAQDVTRIDEAHIDKVFLQLQAAPLSPGRKKKHWGFYRRFVRYLYEHRLIELPRNLDSHKFTVQPRKIKTHTVEEVRHVINSLKSRLKLYALLGLNCGMIQTDMAQLTKDMVDLERGIITRRRVKTGHIESVPTVTYPLWPETVQLLKEHQANHPTLFLTNTANHPLLETRIEDGKAKRYDMIAQQFKRSGSPIHLKEFRAIAATFLESHETYGRYVAHFLGHSPRGVTQRHYASPSEQQFAAALAWLREQIFSIDTQSKVEVEKN